MACTQTCAVPAIVAPRGDALAPRRVAPSQPSPVGVISALACTLGCVCGPLTTVGRAQEMAPGEVLIQRKVSNSSGNLTAVVPSFATFGGATTPLGDIDGDGRDEIAVGAASDFDEFGPESLSILTLSSDGIVLEQRDVAHGVGGLDTGPEPTESFAVTLAGIGDLNGDGIPDLVAGEPGSNDAGFDKGALWILFLDVDGSLRGQHKLSAATDPLLAEALDPGDHFGRSVTALGDLDGDGVPDLAAGAPNDDDGGPEHGAVYVLFMNTDGSLKQLQKISDTQGGFDATLLSLAFLGESIANIGDLDDDGITDLVIGAYGMHEGGSQTGGVFVVFLNADGTVKQHQKISQIAGGLEAQHDSLDLFGGTVAALGDVDGDGVEDIAVGSTGDDDGGFNRGAAYVLLLERDGRVHTTHKISSLVGGFQGQLDDEDWFGAVGCPGDINGDGIGDLAVGALFDDDGSVDTGALWLLFLQGADCDAINNGDWSDLGHGLAGLFGEPCLFGFGALEGGNTISVALRAARGQSRAQLAVGVQAVDTPFKGGVMVPDVLSPPGFLTTFTTDRHGRVDLDTTWPGGVPQGAQIYLQFWIDDPTAPQNLSASNAIVGSVP